MGARDGGDTEAIGSWEAEEQLQRSPGASSKGERVSERVGIKHKVVETEFKNNIIPERKVIKSD